MMDVIIWPDKWPYCHGDLPGSRVFSACLNPALGAQGLFWDVTRAWPAAGCDQALPVGKT